MKRFVILFLVILGIIAAVVGYVVLSNPDGGLSEFEYEAPS